MWVLIILYFQILFAFIKYIYRYSGIIYCTAWLGTLIYNSVAASWLASDKCTSTEYYGLAMFNTIFYFVVGFFFMLTVTLVLFIRALILTRSTVSPQKAKQAPKEQELGESEEKMIEEKEEPEDLDQEEEPEDRALNQNKMIHRKTKDPVDEDEEDDTSGRMRNADPIDEDEEEEANNVEDQLERELEKIT